MTLVYQTEAEDIASLDALKLTRLLKLLLILEARSFGIAERAVDVGLNIQVGDGGEDGRIEWSGSVRNTDYLPNQLVQFQSKAVKKMGPADCANEVVDRDGHVKSQVHDVLSRGGSYILFTTLALNARQKRERIKKIREMLVDKGMSYAGSAEIDVYDASTICSWTNKFAPAITAVLNWVGRPLIDGAHTWESWEQLPENQLFEFAGDEPRQGAMHDLRNILKTNRTSARIIGLSGLGKTRLALETCRGEEGHDSLRHRVVYLDAAYGAPNLAGTVSSWVTSGLDGLLVVDNCELKLHQQLKREISRSESKLSLLTIHYNPDTDSETPIIELRAMPDSLIQSMLEPVFGEQIQDLDRIVAFAQGFPQMAYLLAKSRLDRSGDMGSLTDDEILEKMLWGGKGVDRQDETNLQACSLFDKFGCEDEAEEELKFIADKVAGCDDAVLFRCIKAFERRGVISRVGRYSAVVPKPLAIRLAADWWRNTQKRKQEDLIMSPMPGRLGESFCEQVAKLDFLPEVKDLTKELCGEQGPFGQAEVILSDRGSRLFRALVEVNPLITSESLHRLLENLTITEIEKINGEPRRNIVRALEKLCFHRDAFPKAARSLLMMAAAENETWANNATGQFRQLFRVFLSGAAGPPEERIAVIDEALASDRPKFRKLAVAALDSAIDTSGGSRTIGAEYQGSGEPLAEWRPKIWQEAFDYWSACIERLGIVAIGGSGEAEQAKESIGTHIRSLMQLGEPMMVALDRAIKMVVDDHGPLWRSALRSIRSAQSFDTDRLPEAARTKLDEWIKLLTPTSLEERLQLIVSQAPNEHERTNDGSFVDVAQMRAMNLAKELAADIDSVTPYFADLLEGEQRQGFVFGQALITAVGNWRDIYRNALDQAIELDDPNISLLLGMLSGINEIDSNYWDQCIKEFADRRQLQEFYPSVITTGSVSRLHLDTILELIASGGLQVSQIGILAYGRAINGVSGTDVSEFVESIANYSDEGAFVALDILSMYCHGDKSAWKQCRTAFADLVLRVPLAKKRPRQQMDMYHWKEAAERLLVDAKAGFATDLMSRLVEAAADKLDYGDMHHYVRPVVRVLLEKYGAETWPILGRAIVKADPVLEYQLGQLLTTEDTFEATSKSVLTSLSDELIEDWCRREPDVGPAFLASIVETFVEDGESWKLSPRVNFLIDNYGDDPNVLRSLSSNLSTFGWTGSVVPYHKSEVQAIEHLLRHEKKSVRVWAERRTKYLNERIEIEQTRDAEESWGIY